MSLTTDKLFDVLHRAYVYTPQAKTGADWRGKTIWKGRIVKFGVTGFECKYVAPLKTFRSVQKDFEGLIADSFVKRPLERELIEDLCELDSNRDFVKIAINLERYSQLFLCSQRFTTLQTENNKRARTIKDDPERPLVLERLCENIEYNRKRKSIAHVEDCSKSLNKYFLIFNNSDLLRSKNAKALSSEAERLLLIFNTKVNSFRFFQLDTCPSNDRKSLNTAFEVIKRTEDLLLKVHAFQIITLNPSIEQLLQSMTRPFTKESIDKPISIIEFKISQLISVQIKEINDPSNPKWSKRQKNPQTRLVNIWFSIHIIEPLEKEPTKKSKSTRKVSFAADVYKDRYNKLDRIYNYFFHVRYPADKLNKLDERLNAMWDALKEQPINPSRIDEIEEAAIDEIIKDVDANNYLYRPSIDKAIHLVILQKKYPELYPGLLMFDQLVNNRNVSALTIYAQWVKLVQIVVFDNPQLLRT